jgi:hypothetical protein
MLNRYRGIALIPLLILVLAFAACAGTPKSAEGPAPFPQAKLVKRLSPSSKVVFEQTDNFVVRTGSACAEGREGSVGIEGSENLPSYVNAATVFLSGWHVTYLEGDHQVGRLGTLIDKVRLEGTILKWEASGFLQDKNMDDPYRWCYYFTVVGWNRPLAVDAVIDQTGVINAAFLFSEPERKDVSTLAVLPAYLQNAAFAGKHTVAVLPRGFQMGWKEGSDLRGRLLRHLAYHQTPAAPFIQSGKDYRYLAPPFLPSATSRAHAGFVSWDTHGILRDKEAKQNYRMSGAFAAIAGNEIGFVQPPYSLVPGKEIGASTGCATNGGGQRTEGYVIEDVGFEEAIPVLTGWEIGYPCEDQRVKEIGIWLSDFSYERQPGAAVGKLHYQISSILCDKDCRPGHLTTHNVSILGFRPIMPGRPVATSLTP